jgi:hypothetical protein
LPLLSIGNATDIVAVQFTYPLTPLEKSAIVLFLLFGVIVLITVMLCIVQISVLAALKGTAVAQKIRNLHL